VEEGDEVDAEGDVEEKGNQESNSDVGDSKSNAEKL
jgi:hypothetical protein